MPEPTVWFTADLHFGHDWLAKKVRRWGTLLNHDRDLEDRWNERIAPQDTVWVLGDFSFLPTELVTLLFERLHGEKHLIRGNHDGARVYRLPWASQHDFRRVRWQGHSFWCMHYPLLTWPNSHEGSFHLHGHSHGMLRAPVTTRMDVGIDATGEIAVSAEQVLETMNGREYVPVDHHAKER